MDPHKETAQLNPDASERLAEKRPLVEWLGRQVSATEASLARIRHQTYIDTQIRDAGSPAGLDWGELLSVPGIVLQQFMLGALRGAQWLCSRQEDEQLESSAGSNQVP
jgi:hypothetical protein